MNLFNIHLWQMTWYAFTPLTPQTWSLRHFYVYLVRGDFLRDASFFFASFLRASISWTATRAFLWSCLVALLTSPEATQKGQLQSSGGIWSSFGRVQPKWKTRLQVEQQRSSPPFPHVSHKSLCCTFSNTTSCFCSGEFFDSFSASSFSSATLRSSM